MHLTGIVYEIIPKVDISQRYEILDVIVNERFLSFRPAQDYIHILFKCDNRTPYLRNPRPGSSLQN